MIRDRASGGASGWVLARDFRVNLNRKSLPGSTEAWGSAGRPIRRGARKRVGGNDVSLRILWLVESWGGILGI